MTNTNCLSYWFPRIQAAGLPVPKTTIIQTPCELVNLLDGVTPDGFHEFVREVMTAGEAMGWPIFLRTGHISGKHDWCQTCYVPRLSEVAQHIFRLVEYSNMVDLMGLPTDVWAVRELLETNHQFHAFRGMPIGREFRAFVRDDRVQCIHPYWPKDSIRNPGTEDWEDKLDRMSTRDALDTEIISGLSTRAALAIGSGDWSVDCLQLASGDWIVIDMEDADRSYHWEECAAEEARSHHENVPA